MNPTITKRVGLKVFLAIFLTALVGGFFTTEVEARKGSQCDWPSVQVRDREVRTRVDDRFSYDLEIEGSRDTEVRVEGLPEGLRFISSSEEIRGRAEKAGSYRVKITASNDCGNDHAELLIVVKGQRSTGGTTSKDPNVSIDSNLIINKDGSGVYLTQIPYTGAGDILQISLIVTALTLWGAALAVAMTGNGGVDRVKNFLFTVLALDRNSSQSLIDRSVAAAAPTESFAIDMSDEEVESEELQELRSQANQEKIIFSEKSLKSIALKAETLGGPSKDLLENIIEEAKATYPRVDGYIRIDSRRLEELL